MIISTAHRLRDLQQAIEGVIRGKTEAIRLSLVALLAGGHLLVEDVPGVGKTTLAQAIARCLDCGFQRIQFTSDLLPSDIVGVSIYNQQLGDFEFKPGPIFANIVLADEINRTTPKTQSSLLEAMAEGRVTVENRTFDLPRPFLVMATQNPAEHHGTYPLPESQLDRFMMRIRMGYPSLDEEKEILRRQAKSHPLERLVPLLTAGDLMAMQEEVRGVRVEDSLIDYLMAIVSATRASESFDLGISPRGSLTLYRAAQAMAFSEDRDYCIADDIKRLVVPVFGHRIVLNPRHAGHQGRTDEVERLLGDLLETIPVPL